MQGSTLRKIRHPRRPAGMPIVGVPGLPFGSRFQVGDVRQIYYDAANPEHFRIRGNCTLFLIGVLFLVSGVYLYLNNA